MNDMLSMSYWHFKYTVVRCIILNNLNYSYSVSVSYTFVCLFYGISSHLRMIHSYGEWRYKQLWSLFICLLCLNTIWLCIWHVPRRWHSGLQRSPCKRKVCCSISSRDRPRMWQLHCRTLDSRCECHRDDHYKRTPRGTVGVARQGTFTVQWTWESNIVNICSPFTDSGDVSKWVRNSRVGRKTPNKHIMCLNMNCFTKFQLKHPFSRCVINPPSPLQNLIWAWNHIFDFKIRQWNLDGFELLNISHLVLHQKVPVLPDLNPNDLHAKT